jgi:hypothetical protein
LRTGQMREKRQGAAKSKGSCHASILQECRVVRRMGS